MKKISILLAAALTIAACQKNETPALIADTITAQIEQEAAPTKTYMDASNNIRWSEGDQIVGFMKSSLGLKYQILPSSVGKTSAFFEKVSGGNDYIGAGTEWDHNIVYYPYSEAAEAAKSGDDYVLNVVLPSEQNYAAASFGKGTMAMVAVSEDNDIIFRNVLGGMKLQLKGTQKVKSITLQGKNNEKLSGAAVVTAYTDESKPAITMSSSASTTVTLNCSTGIQLNESSATEFIIALPPVLFSKGFTVTVTDTESNTYTVETDKTNTVIRSSLLVMPAFKLGETPGGDSGEGLVEIVILDRTLLTMAPGTSYTFESEIDPTDVTHPDLVWSSSDNSVATIDQSGKVTAVSDGIVTITALAAGGANATCSVTVKSATVVADTKYVVGNADYGYGIAIGDVVWAPVNCGYEPANGEYKGYPYGKLYQWGRKYGQGYSTYSDETKPEIVEGPVMPSIGKSEEYADVFFTASESPYDWCKAPNAALWNSGTGEAPVKTETDPCPTGWRVPTYKELSKLQQNSLWTTNDEDQEGRFFCGEYTFIEGAPKVFFPAAGYRSSGGNAYDRGGRGYYWSSIPGSGHAYRLYFNDGYAGMYDDFRAYGYSVRCVQVTDEVAEL